jgi:hypothetical protein
MGPSLSHAFGTGEGLCELPRPRCAYIKGMNRVLIVVGLTIAAVGFLWPWLSRIGLGRLPGDIYIRGEHGSFYFPIVTCILLSAAVSLLLWLISR